MQKSMKFLISSRIAAASLAFLAVIALSSCNNRNNKSVSSNSQGSPTNNSTPTSPSESATNSPTSTSPVAAKQGIAPQGTTCPSGNPIKAVNSKRLGKIALTTNSPEYSKIKPEKCFPDTGTAEVAGYKVPQ
jgi:cytoskeletal protein RodZ